MTKVFETRLQNFAPGRPSLDALEELLAVLKQEGIPAALVLAPEGPTLRKLYPSDRLAAFVQQATRFSAQYDCRFVDAFDWLDEEMFQDSMHANVAGAEHFTARLAQEVLLQALTTRETQRSFARALPQEPASSEGKGCDDAGPRPLKSGGTGGRGPGE